MKKPKDVSVNINAFFFIESVDNGVSIQYRDEDGRNRRKVIEKLESETIIQHAERVQASTDELIGKIETRIDGCKTDVTAFINELKNPTEEEENAEE